MILPRVTFAAAFSWLPLAAFLALMLFAVLAWREVGHWPFYASPDPKDQHLPALHAVALLAIPLGTISALVGVIALFLAPER